MRCTVLVIVILSVRLHNIMHGSIESAIPENPLVGPNISGLSVVQAAMGDFVQILGSKFWALGPKSKM